MSGRLATAVGPLVAAALVRVLAATLRVTVVGLEPLERRWRTGQPLIYAVWHGRILMMPWVNDWLRRTRGMRSAVALASRSRDGEVIARFVARFGMGAVRGSSSRGGTEALRALVRVLGEGTDVVIVPDGPRGPRERLQAGIVTLAALAGAPIVPAAFAARPARRLDTWDGFLVPLPFARGVVAFGDPLAVPRDADREGAVRAAEARLHEVTALADRLVQA